MQLLKVFTYKQAITKGIYLQTSNYQRSLPPYKQLLNVFTYKQAATKGLTYKQATTKGIYLQTSSY